MLHTLRGKGFDCLFTLVSIKIEHPQPLNVCTNVCIVEAPPKLPFRGSAEATLFKYDYEYEYVRIITFDPCLWWRIFRCNKVKYCLNCMRVITVKIKMKKGLRPQKKKIIFETYIVFQFFRLTQPTEQCTVTCFFYRLTQPNEQCTVTCFFSFLLTLIRVASQPTLKELLVGIF